MTGHGGGGAQKQSILKPYPELILYKPVGKYQFTMACIRCIRALVMFTYQVINCFISQPKHILWVLKRTVAMRRFFKAPKFRLNLIIKKNVYNFKLKKCVYLDHDFIQHADMLHLSEHV